MLLRILNDMNHHLKRLQRVFTLCGLSRKHNRICSVVNSIRHISNLCSCRARITDHRVKHLCRRNNRLKVVVALLDHHFLKVRNFFRRNLHAQIASCYHDTIRRTDDLIDITDSFRIFNLRDDRCVRSIQFFKIRLNLKNTLRISHKGCRNKINPLFYAKTDIIPAGGTAEDVTVTIPLEYLRSYDENAYDGAGGYTVAAGDYYIAFGTDAHDAVNNILAAKGKTAADGMTKNGDAAFTHKFNLSADEAKNYSEDYNQGADGEPIQNELSDIDVTAYDASFTYLSRSDWQGTWPEVKPFSATQELVTAMSEYFPNISDDEEVSMPATGASQMYSLIDMKGLAYDSKEWNILLDQLSVSDMQTLICNGAYGTPGIPSINKDATLDKDGPAGISATLIGGKGTFGFPVETLIAATWNIELAQEMGTFIGEDALLAGVSGWYAPGLNMHRTPFSGRNFEYYSEDSFQAGAIGAAVTEAAQEMGVYTYSKHYALNDEELNRQRVCVFSNEQAAREIYLRPFEMNVRDGGSKGIMVSMNRIGGAWTGAHKGLVTEILRGEWGFTGCVVTDASSIGNTQKGLYAGTDLWLGSGSGSFEEGWESDAGVVTMMRNACHNILYVIANSNAMNGIAPGTVFVPIIPLWQGLLLAADVVIGLACVWGIASIVYCAFIKKDKKGAAAENSVQ